MRSNFDLINQGVRELLGTRPAKKATTISPILISQREDAKEVKIFVYDYNASFIEKHQLQQIQECDRFKGNDHISWINIDGLRKADVEAICEHYDIHSLIAEDILSINQRPKIDEGEGFIFCLLNMLYFNDENCNVDLEQISIVLGKDYVLSFQEDADRDVFNPIREKLKISNSKLRQRAPDYLYYSMLDLIVDSYFVVMEKLGEKIELLEDEVVRNSTVRSLAQINHIRKELIILKKNIAPVRELLNNFIRIESDLLDERTTKYFKDVYDHIVQAYEITENYRDMMTSMQDLYINNVNLKMNQVMKVMAIVTCLMAPATVIGGIFGMNFDRIPYLHNKYGFFIAVALMLMIPLWMLREFKRKGWF